MTEDPGLEPGTTAVETAGDARSLLDKIKDRRENREDILKIDIPSWDGDLKAEYKVIAREDIEQMIRRVRFRQSGGRSNGVNNAGTEADADFLIKACIGVIAVDQETGAETKIADGYNRTLIEILEPENTNDEKGLVVYLFKGNSIALAAHGQKIARWMQDTSKPIEDPT